MQGIPNERICGIFGFQGLVCYSEELWHPRQQIELNSQL